MAVLASLLVQRLGSAGASLILAKLRKRPFRRRYVGRVRKSEALSAVEARRLRTLLRDIDVYLPLFDTATSASIELARRLDAEVLTTAGGLPTSTHDTPSARALGLAETMRTQLMASLETPDAFAALGYQVRKVHANLEAVHDGIAAVSHDVAAVHRAVTVKAPEPEAWALLQGPIAALELDGKREEALQLLASDPARAATMLHEVVFALEQGGYAALATPVAIDRARALSASVDVVAAAAAWTDLVALAITSGGNFGAPEGLRALEELGKAAGAPSWVGLRASALSLLERWPGDPALEATTAIKAVVDCAHAGDPEACALLAMASEIALAVRDVDALRAVPVSLARYAEAPMSTIDGIRFALAMAEVGVAGFPNWDDLLSTARRPDCNPRLSSLILARSARRRFWLDDLYEAEASFRSAVERGCVARLWENAASWTLAAWRAASGSDRLTQQAFDYPKSAQSLRAVGGERLRPRAYDPHMAALEYLNEGKINVALPPLRRMLRDGAADADLETELTAHSLLGQVYAASGIEPGLALFHYCLAGSADAAGKIAASAMSYLDCRSHAESPRSYTRAAAFRAAEAQADLIPDAEIHAWAVLAIDEIRRGRLTLLGPQAWVEAFKLIAAIAGRIDDEVIDAMIDAVDRLLPRASGTYTWADEAIVVFLAQVAEQHLDRCGAVAQRLVTICSVSDVMATQVLTRGAAVEACLPLIKDDLRALAAGGNKAAGQLLSLYDVEPDIAREAVRAELDRAPAYTTDGVTSSMSLLGNGPTLAAHHARVLPEVERAELALSYLSRALDPHDAELNRSQCVRGITILALQG